MPVLAVPDAVCTCSARVEGEQHAGKDAQDCAAQGVIPGQAVAEAIRERQDPLAHRHPRQHLVNEVSGAFGHPSSSTTRTEATPLTGEGQEALEGAVGAPKPREAMGQYSARKELAEFLLDEAGQTVSVAALGDFLNEGFEVLTNDGVEDGVVLGAAPMPRDGYTAPARAGF